MKKFDPIDIFFIVLISSYFITLLFIIITMTGIKIHNYIKNRKTISDKLNFKDNTIKKEPITVDVKESKSKKSKDSAAKPQRKSSFEGLAIIRKLFFKEVNINNTESPNIKKLEVTNIKVEDNKSTDKKNKIKKLPSTNIVIKNEKLEEPKIDIIVKEVHQEEPKDIKDNKAIVEESSKTNTVKTKKSATPVNKKQPTKKSSKTKSSNQAPKKKNNNSTNKSTATKEKTNPPEKPQVKETKQTTKSPSTKKTNTSTKTKTNTVKKVNTSNKKKKTGKKKSKTHKKSKKK